MKTHLEIEREVIQNLKDKVEELAPTKLTYPLELSEKFRDIVSDTTAFLLDVQKYEMEGNDGKQN